jgi:hypothetical protein
MYSPFDEELFKDPLWSLDSKTLLEEKTDNWDYVVESLKVKTNRNIKHFKSYILRVKVPGVHKDIPEIPEGTHKVTLVNVSQKNIKPFPKSVFVLRIRNTNKDEKISKIPKIVNSNITELFIDTSLKSTSNIKYLSKLKYFYTENTGVTKFNFSQGPNIDQAIMLVSDLKRSPSNFPESLKSLVLDKHSEMKKVDTSNLPNLKELIVDNVNKAYKPVHPGKGIRFYYNGSLFKPSSTTSKKAKKVVK